jgi:hypothetical protein
LISAFLIASALNFTSAGISNEREDRSMNALRKAKAALIAYAANEQWQNTGGATPFQPGALPCPDRDNDGIAEDHEFPQKPCDTPLKRIGRFPWQTIGADDLRDASGESLWYAVSAGFLKNTPSYTNVINSDTLGQLTVSGSAPASNVVAIVFAPGEAIQGQVRSPANLNDPASYLEQFDSLTYATFTSTGLPSAINNDRLLVITQADLMAVVEPIVAANIERDVKPLLADYFAKWGAVAYPFAAPFVLPPAGQSAYRGASNQTMGLVPLTNDPTWLTWPSATVTDIVGSGTGNYDAATAMPMPPLTISPNPTSCTISSSQATCTINYPGGGGDRPDLKIEITLNASTAFADTPSMPAPDTLAMVDRDGVVLSDTDPGFGKWSAVGSPQNPPALSGFVLKLAGGVVTYTGRLQNARDTNNRVTITVPLPAPSYLPRLTNTSPTNPNITWFTSNQWYRQTYYAISPGFAPGGGGSCNPLPATPSCLTVNNLPAPKDNKRAILVFAGRALDGSARPSGNLANYLEGQNSTPADFIYEHRAGTPTAINDRVVVVSP